MVFIGNWELVLSIVWQINLIYSCFGFKENDHCFGYCRLKLILSVLLCEEVRELMAASFAADSIKNIGFNPLSCFSSFFFQGCGVVQCSEVYRAFIHGWNIGILHQASNQCVFDVAVSGECDHNWNDECGWDRGNQDAWRVGCPIEFWKDIGHIENQQRRDVCFVAYKFFF